MLQSMGLRRVGHDWATEQQVCNILNVSLFSDSGLLITIKEFRRDLKISSMC